MKKIVLLEFKRTSDVGESYFRGILKIEEKHHTPILLGGSTGPRGR